MTGRQECLRAIAQSRRDEDRVDILVLPRSSALHHWPLPPLWGHWISAVSTSSELKSFLLSMCIDAPESTTNSRSSGDFEVGRRHCPGLNGRVKRSFYRYV